MDLFEIFFLFPFLFCEPFDWMSGIHALSVDDMVDIFSVRPGRFRHCRLFKDI